MNIIKNRKIYFAISAVIILAGIVMACINGFNLDVEFKGGTEIVADFGKAFDTNDVAKTLSDTIDEKVTGANIQKMGDDKTSASIKVRSLNTDERSAVEKALEEKYGATIVSNDTISPVVGNELKQSAFWGALIAVVLMLLYITVRFEILSGCAAVCALIHDVLIMLSVYTIFQIPVDTSLIAALLTILGYSINATIVLFDRVREMQRENNKMPFEAVVNNSVKSTMGRSLNTTFTTLVVLVVLYFMGVDSIKTFTLPIITGVVAGCYSSVFLSGNFWYMFKKLRKDKNLAA